MPYIFTPSQAEQAPILSQISLQSKSYWNYPIDWIDQWKDSLTITEQYIDHPKHHVYHIQSPSSEIVGFCALCLEKAYAEIDHMWILPKFIGKGLGKRLLMQTIEKALPADFNKPIRVVSDPNALSFYEKIGFNSIGWKDSWPEGRKLPILEADKNELIKQN